MIDGNFPTVKSPNPENPEGFYLAVDLAKQVGSDLIIGTDPDSDRVGTMVRGKDGEYHTITGNQMGVLLLDYIINARKETGTMPENPAFLKTIVTTNMGREVAERNGVHVDETFTGFKFMAEKLAEYKRDGSYNYLLAYEESYGYMVGDYVRDKDAVTASMLIAEMAASYFKQGMTLADALEALYEKYGYFGELTMNLVMPGLDGLEKMRAIMAKLRAEPPKEIGGEAVLGMRDYQSGTVSVAELGVVGKTPIVGSNVLYFELADGTAFIVRPSGTEPKIKVYILAQGESRADCDGRIARYKAFAETITTWPDRTQPITPGRGGSKPPRPAIRAKGYTAYERILQLFWAFMKVGALTFGGGYAMLPILQRDIVEHYKWASEEEVMDYYAMAQCLPGIIMVNTSTFHRPAPQGHARRHRRRLRLGRAEPRHHNGHRHVPHPFRRVPGGAERLRRHPRLRRGAHSQRRRQALEERHGGLEDARDSLPARLRAQRLYRAPRPYCWSWPRPQPA